MESRFYGPWEHFLVDNIVKRYRKFYINRDKFLRNGECMLMYLYINCMTFRILIVINDLEIVIPFLWLLSKHFFQLSPKNFIL